MKKTNLRFVGGLAGLMVLVGASLVARADEAEAVKAPKNPRPETLKCITKNGAGEAAAFEFSAFNTAKPSSTLDGSIDGEIDADATWTEFCLNNGCDNNYCFVFYTQDLSQLAEKKVPNVTGLLSYFNSELEETDEQTIPILCY